MLYITETNSITIPSRTRSPRRARCSGGGCGAAEAPALSGDQGGGGAADAAALEYIVRARERWRAGKWGDVTCKFVSLQCVPH
jgi:hypothetical protein